MGSGEFPNLLADFMRYYPDVTISLQLTNRTVDLAEEGIDVELRSGPVEDANLIVRKLRLMNMVVCASPVYWKKHGKPEHPRDLATHEALTFSLLGQQPVWRFDDNGTPLDVPVKSRMDCTEGAPLIRVAMHGFGVIYLPSILVQSHLDHGELVPVLPEYARKDMWLSAAYLQRRHNSAALRALLDFLQTRVGPGSTPRKAGHS
jgi:DNA-binding transcriptional LysR family regulator